MWPKTHGQSDRHRAPGSIGAEVLQEEYGKEQKCLVIWGQKKSLQKGLKITKIDKENNIIEVKGGSVPGSNTNAVIVLKENYAS